MLAACLGILLIRTARVSEPRYEGKTLRRWLRGHPRDYQPVIRAMGTNALPFLLSEIRRRDPLPHRFLEECLRTILDARAPWETARDRRYHARLALQILDTNAVPVLLGAVFSEPMHLDEGNLPFAAAEALTWMASTEAGAQAAGALTEALESADPERCRNACLAIGHGFRLGDKTARRLIRLLSHDEARVRAAATRALIPRQTVETEVLPALVARLDDEQAAVRRLAIDALGVRGSDAVAAVPALRAAWLSEPKRSRRTDPVDDLYHGDQTLSAAEVRGSIRWAIRQIDPQAPLP